MKTSLMTMMRTIKELPILIHELEYYDQIADQNIEANGDDLVRFLPTGYIVC